MSRKLHRPIVEKRDLVVPITQGGTYADDVVEAATNLKLVTNDMVNAANGIAGLDANGDILVSQIPAGLTLESIKVSGPSSVFAGSTNIWTITDYDQYSTYTLSATNGFVTRAKDKIYYTAPLTVGNYGFTVNGKVVAVATDDRYVTKPNIVSPLPDNTNVGSAMTVVSSDFLVSGGFQETLIQASDATGQDYFGQQTIVSSDGTLMVVGAVGCTVGGVVDCGAAYVFRKSGSTWTQEAKLSASDKAANGLFGGRIAISADNQRIVVTDLQADPGAISNAGAAYVFTWSGSAWAQEAILTASDKAVSDLFGTALAISDDGTRIVVGAHYNDAGGLANSGAAYVFSRSGTTWTQEQKLSASDKAANDAFGNFLSMAGDASRVAISAPYCTISGVTQAGAVYIFTRSGTVWTQEQKINGNDYQINNLFGYRFALSNDGLMLVIAAQATVFGLATAGQVYVFNRSGSVWTQETQKLIAKDIEAGALFGLFINIPVDKSRLIIGSSQKNDSGIGGSGKVYVFGKNNNAWVQEATITASDKQYLDHFGTYTSLSSDGSVLAVAAWERNIDANAVDTGAVYLYSPSFHASTDWQLSTDPAFGTIVQQSASDAVNRRSWSISDLTLNTDYYIRCRYNGTQYGTSEWSETTHIKTRSSWLPNAEQAILTASDKATGDQYGISVALSSDGSRMAVGANLKTVGGLSQAGQVYVYTRSGSTWVEETKFTAPDTAASDSFGVSVALSADGSRLVVGAGGKLVTGLTNAGKVYSYTRSGTTWTYESAVTASDKAANDVFGVSVAISADGTRMAVGANAKTISTFTNCGKVYVYTRSGSTWSEETTLTAADKAVGDFFGSSIAFDATAAYVAVGASYKTVSAVSQAGKVYIYKRNGTTYTEESTIVNPSPVASDFFGHGIALNGDGSLLTIGAYLKDVNGVTDAGKLYMYTRSGVTWTEVSELIASDITASEQFGFRSALTQDAKILAVGCRNRASGGLTGSGSVFIFM